MDRHNRELIQYRVNSADKMYRVGQGARTCAMPGVDDLQQSDELADTMLKYWSYSHQIRHRYRDIFNFHICFVETPKRKECKSFFTGPERLVFGYFYS